MSLMLIIKDECKYIINWKPCKEYNQQNVLKVCWDQ